MINLTGVSLSLTTIRPANVVRYFHTKASHRVPYVRGSFPDPHFGTDTDPEPRTRTSDPALFVSDLQEANK
jgi:hypothetical protein